MMATDKVDHILRAAGAHTGQKHFVLIGSAAIFAWRKDVPAGMAMTREVDLFAYDVPPAEAERIAVELDGSLGMQSPFDATFGYYCDGVGPETAILPTDWSSRAKSYASDNTGGVTATVPHPSDIAAAKLCAGREKDTAWLRVALAQGIVDLEELRLRLETLPVDRIGDRLPELRGQLALLVPRS